MAYMHGVYINEDPTPIITPLLCDSGIQVVVGTSPVNMATDILAAVNRPVVVYSFTEAVRKMGYSNNFNKFTLCQSMDATFRVFNVAPLVMINVLDPYKHTSHRDPKDYNVSDRKLIVNEEGVLLGSLTVLGDGKTLKQVADYGATFDDSGFLVIYTEKVYAKLTISYDYLDPSKVTELDIIGGYNALTGEYKGLELVEQLYPRLGLIPGQILAPGWSHKPAVNAVMTSKLTNINGNFKCTGISDLDTTEAHTYDLAYAWKTENGYVNENLVACWPKVVIDKKVYYMSAIWAALTAYVDAMHESVPYKSPSNEKMRITGTVVELSDAQRAYLLDNLGLSEAYLSNGAGADNAYLFLDEPDKVAHETVYLDHPQANHLNGLGICTALNLNGWKSWGNNTSIYPMNTDIKDRFISVRRMFNWWGNTFILTYFAKVDDPMDLRLIESIVDSENIRANGLQAKGMIAHGRISYDRDKNQITDILNGQMYFRQELAFSPPAEAIINTLVFNPYALREYLTGGDMNV